MDEQQYEAIDAQILRGIDRQRIAHGACTTGNLAADLRLAKSTVALRCAGLRDRGLVTWSDNYAGSLQRVQTTDQRLREMLIVDAVERASLEQGEIAEWCREVLGHAQQSPDLPAAARTGDEPPQEEDPVTSTPAAAAETATGEEISGEWYCAPCAKPFKTRVALLGHERASKIHLARLGQQPVQSDAPETVGAGV